MTRSFIKKLYHNIAGNLFHQCKFSSKPIIITSYVNACSLMVFSISRVSIFDRGGSLLNVMKLSCHTRTAFRGGEGGIGPPLDILEDTLP